MNQQNAYNLCIIKPNKSVYSETFIQEHIDRLKGNKKVLYGGSFPVYDHEDKFLIRSKIDLLIYLFQKKILKRKDIAVRNKALVNYLKIEKIDLVFAEYGTVGAMVTKACKMANVPIIVHFHGADAHHFPTLNEYSEYYHSIFSYSSFIVTVSKDMSTQLIKLGAVSSKIFLNPCGVNTDKFKVVDVVNSRSNFITIGRFVEKKSPLSIIKAFKIVSHQISECHLWMVGNGPLWSDASELIKNYDLEDKITLTGVLKPIEILNLLQIMRGAVQHSVTSPSGDKEGTPVSILEESSLFRTWMTFVLFIFD